MAETQTFLAKLSLQKRQHAAHLPFFLHRNANLDVVPVRKVEVVNIWMFAARLLMVSLLLCCFVNFHLGNVIDDYYNNQSIHFSSPIESFNPAHEKMFYNDNPIIHIVNTRFMQEQADLYYLSFARLHLFETFCFPSMVHQTIQPKNTTSSLHDNDSYKFLWIIKVDPKINETIKNRLVQLLSPYPNFYLVGSNNNFGIGRKGGSWRTGEAGEDIFQTSTSSSLRYDRIYTGSIPLLHFAYRMREERVVLETRLDADDGLPFSYLETIQQKAWMEWGNDKPITSTSKNNTPDNDNRTAANWLYWCVTNALNWYPTVIMMKNATSGSDSSSQDEKELSLLKEHIQATKDAGLLYFSYDPTICYSPGLTVGLPVRATYYPRFDHYNMLWQGNRVHCMSTDEVQKNCIQPLPPSIYAIRSRSPTSAGFKDLINISVSTTWTAPSIRKSTDQRERLISLNVNGWDLVRQQYNISQNRAHETNLFLHQNLLLILQDNWIGQCSSGHSCKHKTKEELGYMIQSLPGGSKVYESLQKMKKKKKIDT